MTQQAASVEPPGDDDTWDMALPGEQAALEALLWNWGECYEIGVDDGEWWFRRKDDKGGPETAATPDELRAQIALDYSLMPVPRNPPPGDDDHPAASNGHPARTRPGNAVITDPEYWTVAEVATMARVSKMTIYRLVHDGQLDSIRVGHSLRISSQAVITYFNLPGSPRTQPHKPHPEHPTPPR